DTTSGEADYILKVHLDKFQLLDGALSNHDPYSTGKYFIVYPNPVNSGTIYLKQTGDINLEITSVRFYDLQGRLLSTTQLQPSQQVIEIDHHLQEGMYFLQWQAVDGAFGVEKISVVGKR
ncbi:MAG TPA: T9SS type A sorting domain-containing protein, partial [Saprospiraceae bacterium]